jgi:hypothetical protein
MFKAGITSERSRQRAKFCKEMRMRRESSGLQVSNLDSHLAEEEEEDLESDDEEDDDDEEDEDVSQPKKKTSTKKKKASSRKLWNQNVSAHW